MTEILDAAQWLALAADDFDAAQILHSLRSGFPAKVCFLAQQCAERAIKAVVVDCGAELRRTHDLTGLLELMRAAGVEVPDSIAAAAQLTPYAVELRYASLDLVSPAEAAAALAQAERLLAWARALVAG